jgi:hypothetical protein
MGSHNPSSYRKPIKADAEDFEGGVRIGVEGIDFDAMDARLAGKPADDDRAGDDMERNKNRLEACLWLSGDGATALEIGRRVLIIAHKASPEETQRELARKLGMDEGQLSRKVKSTNEFLANGFNGN